MIPDSPAIVTLTVTAANGCSATVTDTFNFPTSISDLENQSLHIYPNPVTENLFIETNLTSLSRMEIMNVEGKIMRNENFARTISVQSLAPGIYELTVFSVDGMVVGKKRFVKM